MSDKQLPLPGVINDPATYRKLSEPFATAEEANDALQKFWEGVYELRKQCRIADVYMVVGFNVAAEDGEEGRMMGILHAGDEMIREAMSAYAFGREQADRQSRTARLIGKNAVTKLARKSRAIMGMKS